MNPATFFADRSGLFWQLFSVLLVLLIGFADYATGEELSVSIFYLLPVTLATWFVSRRAGVVFAAISAAAWLLADLLAGHVYRHPAIPYWNMTVRFGFFLVVLVLLSRLKTAYEREKTLSIVDSLTGATNGRGFQETAAAELDRARRYGRPFTVVYVDLDNFKEVNDRYGHSTGDALLRSVAETIRKNVRSSDVVARLGGDEFALLLPETGEESARPVLAKVRDTVTDSMRANGWPVTLSIGAVTFLSPPESVDRMVGLADDLMYSVKRGGKNRVLHEVLGG